MRVVPGDAQKAVRSRREGDRGLLQSLSGEVEQRALAREQRPVFAIAGTFEHETFQKWCADARHANRIRRQHLAEVGLEAARLLGLGYRKNARALPRRFCHRWRHEEVRNLLTGSVIQPEVV